MERWKFYHSILRKCQTSKGLLISLINQIPFLHCTLLVLEMFACDTACCDDFLPSIVNIKVIQNRHRIGTNQIL